VLAGSFFDDAHGLVLQQHNIMRANGVEKAVVAGAVGIVGTSSSSLLESQKETAAEDEKPQEGKDLNMEIAKLGQKKDLRATNENGDTLLHLAIKTGRTKLVRTLLRRGVPPDVQNEQGSTLLHEAVKQSNTDIVNLLLNDNKLTVNPNVQDDKLMTPLHYAVKQRCVEIVKSLVDTRRVNIHIKSRYAFDMSPLQIAMDYRNPEIFALLFPTKISYAEQSAHLSFVDFKTTKERSLYSSEWTNHSDEYNDQVVRGVQVTIKDWSFKQLINGFRNEDDVRVREMFISVVREAIRYLGTHKIKMEFAPLKMGNLDEPANMAFSTFDFHDRLFEFERRSKDDFTFGIPGFFSGINPFLPNDHVTLSTPSGRSELIFPWISPDYLKAAKDTLGTFDLKTFDDNFGKMKDQSYGYGPLSFLHFAHMGWFFQQEQNSDIESALQKSRHQILKSLGCRIFQHLHRLEHLDYNVYVSMHGWHRFVHFNISY